VGEEAPLRMSRNSLVTHGAGWFVVNARESRWREAGPLGAFCAPYEEGWLPDRL
jgi:hypothetical protein